MRSTATRLSWLLCVLSLGVVAGCGNDSEKETPATIDQAADLDCTDETDGRPEDIPEGAKEIYVPEAIKKLLAEDEKLRKRLGADEVESCAEARRFTELYKEEEERITAEWLEKNPPDIPEEAPDASEGEFPTDEVPVPDDEFAAEEDDGTAGAAGEVQKISYGNNGWSYRPTVKITINGGLCTATAISSRHLLTAAHCVSNGELMTTIHQQQKVLGAQPTLLFGGAIKVKWERNPAWTGTGNYSNDVAVGQTVLTRHKFTDTTGVWLGAVYQGDLTYQWGYGRIDPKMPSPGVFHWGQGTVGWVGSAYYYVEADKYYKQTACLGDSGGFTGGYHGTGWLSVDAVISGENCPNFSLVTRANYHIDFITKIVERAASCADYYTGYGIERWCF